MSLKDSPSWITALLLWRGLHYLIEAISHALQGYPRWTGHIREFWQNMIHWMREWQIIPLYLPGVPHELHKGPKKKKWHQKLNSPRSEGVQHGTVEEQRRIIHSPRMNEAAGPKWIQHSVADVPGDGSKTWCCKEQYCMGTWNVMSMNQGKLDLSSRRC